MDPVHLQFNSQQLYSPMDVEFANINRRIYVNPNFLLICIGKRGLRSMNKVWGIDFYKDLASKFGYNNYRGNTGLAKGFTPYPDITFGGVRTFNVPRGGIVLSDIGQGMDNYFDIRNRVQTWVFNEVIPHHLLQLFS